MIEEISIRNLGVIGEAVLPLGAGLTVLTGETGAGKTMVVTALGLLLGDRADAQAIRSGAKQAVVEGRWVIDDTGPVAERVRDAGGDIDDGELILGRSVSSEGRSRAVVGGRSAPISVLTEVGQQLVVVHGQSDQLRLKSSIAQRDALDRFAGSELGTALAAYTDAYDRWRAASSELAMLAEERDRRAREADGLRVAMAEIEAAAPRAGEDDELAASAERLANAEDLRLAAAQAHEHVSSEDIGEPHDVIGLLDAARRQLERVSAHDPALQPVIDALRDASYLAVDVSGQLAAYLGDLDADSARELEAVQERRAELATIVRKYGPTIDDAIAYLDTGSARLLELDSDSDRIEQLHEQVVQDAAAVADLAARLTAVRVTHAEKLSAAVTTELAALAMANASLHIEVTERADFAPHGRDQVAFLLKPHSGADPRPLGKGASGGELSRVMLAIEVVVAGADPVPTFIFDEVDAGVGGASAIEIGRRLASLARTSQVIVVTHLAQVAAFATNHLRVAKSDGGSVTASSVERLDGDDRVAEMARLLSGLPDSDSGLTHARELIELATAS
ncbi:DNA repair protein RecN [Marisediminicola senii]|uniref:DNA repair protein RecN n=1 Tax=Marisediminicola senii TaxID=2711233 RepID=UPI0013EB1834|nr:DNA repair protein RecN [Marisediminicola senii]